MNREDLIHRLQDQIIYLQEEVDSDEEVQEFAMSFDENGNGSVKLRWKE